ncbi:MAG TPA: DNA polymerase IV [Candidatus Scatosoma pullicola]|nr:DNA polymerase IV [Candidatus Scatosoma pullicola]
MRDRVILYSDLNNFFASVETLLHPEYRGKPLIVCGDPKERRGVVFAKNEEAKKYGIRTAETVVSALKKCPQVLRAETHFGEYKKYSRKVKEIYGRFTDLVEACSIDECALDMTASVAVFGSGEEIAEKIRRAVKEELGLTVSVGVSFNKVFAKIASDMKKPDAVTVVSRENYKQKLWPLPVGAMLFVGKATEETLVRKGIRTIGDLAAADPEMLARLFGKRGRLLGVYARGEDDEPVRGEDERENLKSVGNSMTLPADVTDRAEIKRLLYVLAESVAARLRDADVGKADTVHVVVRNERMEVITFQKKVPPTALCGEIAEAAFDLFCRHCPPGTRAHMLGITVSGFDYHVEQLALGEETGGRNYEKKERAEKAVAKLREKYGYATVQRGLMLEDERLAALDLRGRKEESPEEEGEKGARNGKI